MDVKLNLNHHIETPVDYEDLPRQFWSLSIGCARRLQSPTLPTHSARSRIHAISATSVDISPDEESSTDLTTR